MTGLLFIPAHPPMDLLQQNTGKGVRLYVKRVFIMDEAEELVPEWLRFLRGVVDSEDLPLNVSREILQQERVTTGIRKQIVGKALSMIEELEEEGETTKSVGEGDDAKETTFHRFNTFWQHFGRVMKEGIHFDASNRERIAKLLRYHTSSGDEPTSLQEYVDRMPSDQESIYYVIAETLDTAQNSPHIEALKARGREVLLMSDAVDEWVVESLGKFADKEFVSAAKGSLDLPDSEEEKKEMEAQTTLFSGLVEKVKTSLDEHVSEVRVTNRLTDSPACLVSAEHGMSPYLEKVLRASGQDIPKQKRILELNPDHAVVQNLQEMAKDDANAEDVKTWSELLFDQALVAEGNLPSDPASFAKSITRLMRKAVD
jgi:molecular chaperone HtpG